LMTPGSYYDASHARLSRDQQVTQARDEAWAAGVALGHELGAWHHAGVVADEEAVCRRCHARIFLLYGTNARQPLVGCRRYGTGSRSSRCFTGRITTAWTASALWKRPPGWLGSRTRIIRRARVRSSASSRGA